MTCQSGERGNSLKKRAVNKDSPPSARAIAERGGSSLEAALRQDLDEWERAGLYRSLRPVSGRAGPRMRVATADGTQREVLMLAGANYLDLAGHPEVVAAGQRALERFGAASGGARLISGNLELHTELEARLADFLGLPSALLFSTGYMANLGVITALCQPGDTLVSDALNHASIIDACRLAGARTLVFRHNDLDHFEQLARKLDPSPANAVDLSASSPMARGRTRPGRRILVVDGVYSMDGDRAPLRELVPLARRYGFSVIVDDAHGIGALGPNGRGSVELAGVEVDALIGNLGKAFGSFGAFVACSTTVREWLVNKARPFIFTCALPPSAVGAALAALEIVEREPSRRTALQERAAQLRRGLARADLDTGESSTHIVPLLVGSSRSAMELCEAALLRGVYAQGIRYPSVPEPAARLRLTPTAGHSSDDIERCIEILCGLVAERSTAASSAPASCAPVTPPPSSGATHA